MYIIHHYTISSKHDTCAPQFQTSGSDGSLRLRSKKSRCTTSEGGASPSKNRGRASTGNWLLLWRGPIWAVAGLVSWRESFFVQGVWAWSLTGFLASSPFQEKLRMAQEQMRRAEAKCPISALRNSTTSRIMMIIFFHFSIFHEHLMYMKILILHIFPYLLALHQFFLEACRIRYARESWTLRRTSLPRLRIGQLGPRFGGFHSHGDTSKWIIREESQSKLDEN